MTFWVIRAKPVGRRVQQANRWLSPALRHTQPPSLHFVPSDTKTEGAPWAGSGSPRSCKGALHPLPPRPAGPGRPKCKSSSDCNGGKQEATMGAAGTTGMRETAPRPPAAVDAVHREWAGASGTRQGGWRHVPPGKTRCGWWEQNTSTLFPTDKSVSEWAGQVLPQNKPNPQRGSGASTGVQWVKLPVSDSYPARRCLVLVPAVMIPIHFPHSCS